MPEIRTKATPFKIGSSTILLLPKDASAKLPSRGMVLVRGTVNGASFKTPLEPDGRGSHWLKIDKNMKAAAGKPAEVVIEPSKDWPEPDIPADLQKALANDREAQAIWHDITPMARWDWLRWIASTANSETRAKRVGVALSKLKHGTRRPCCFNRALCTVPEVSKGGALLEPESV
jgi:hypothetical protein